MKEETKAQTTTKGKAAPRIWRVSDEVWEETRPLLPVPKPKKKPGRPRVDDRQVLDGIIHVLGTGCQWKQVPKEFCSGSTCHLRFSQWVQAGVFSQRWAVLLQHYDDLHGLEWEWQAMDSASGKAPGVPKKGCTKQPWGRTRPTAASPG
jgi:transposase